MVSQSVGSGAAGGELLDRVVILHAGHLRRLLADYVTYYNTERVHSRFGDTPDGRPADTRPSPTANRVGLPRAGGLPHRYVWQEAA